MEESGYIYYRLFWQSGSWQLFYFPSAGDSIAIQRILHAPHPFSLPSHSSLDLFDRQLTFSCDYKTAWVSKLPCVSGLTFRMAGAGLWVSVAVVVFCQGTWISFDTEKGLGQ